MFTATLNPRHNVVTLINSVEQLLDIPVILMGRHKVFSNEEIGAILKVALPNFALSFEEHYVNFVQNPAGMWGLEVVDRFSGQRNLYLGGGYRKGILSGTNPLSDWDRTQEGDYLYIEDCSEEALNSFSSYSKKISYELMADLLYHFNSGKEWGTCSPYLKGSVLPSNE